MVATERTDPNTLTALEGGIDEAFVSEMLEEAKKWVKARELSVDPADLVTHPKSRPVLIDRVRKMRAAREQARLDMVAEALASEIGDMPIEVGPVEIPLAQQPAVKEPAPAAKHEPSTKSKIMGRIDTATLQARVATAAQQPAVKEPAPAAKPAEIPEPSAEERKIHADIEQSAAYPVVLYTDVDFAGALRWVLIGWIGLHRTLKSESRPVYKDVHHNDQKERLSRIALGEKAQRYVFDSMDDDVRKAFVKKVVDPRIDRLQTAIDHVNYVMQQIHREPEPARYNSRGGMKLRDKIENVLRIYADFANLGELLHFPEIEGITPEIKVGKVKGRPSMPTSAGVVKPLTKPKAVVRAPALKKKTSAELAAENEQAAQAKSKEKRDAHVAKLKSELTAAFEATCLLNKDKDQDVAKLADDLVGDRYTALKKKGKPDEILDWSVEKLLEARIETKKTKGANDEVQLLEAALEKHKELRAAAIDQALVAEIEKRLKTQEFEGDNLAKLALKVSELEPMTSLMGEIEEFDKLSEVEKAAVLRLMRAALNELAAAEKMNEAGRERAQLRAMFMAEAAGWEGLDAAYDAIKKAKAGK